MVAGLASSPRRCALAYMPCTSSYLVRGLQLPSAGACGCLPPFWTAFAQLQDLQITVPRSQQRPHSGCTQLLQMTRPRHEDCTCLLRDAAALHAAILLALQVMA